MPDDQLVEPSPPIHFFGRTEALVNAGSCRFIISRSAGPVPMPLQQKRDGLIFRSACYYSSGILVRLRARRLQDGIAGAPLERDALQPFRN
jgi:hypothetical protein